MKNDLLTDRDIRECPVQVKFYANDQGDVIVVKIFSDGQAGIECLERQGMKYGNRLLGSLIAAVTWLSKRGYTQAKYWKLKEIK